MQLEEFHEDRIGYFRLIIYAVETRGVKSKRRQVESINQAVQFIRTKHNSQSKKCLLQTFLLSDTLR